MGALPMVSIFKHIPLVLCVVNDLWIGHRYLTHITIFQFLFKTDDVKQDLVRAFLVLLFYSLFITQFQPEPQQLDLTWPVLWFMCNSQWIILTYKFNFKIYAKSVRFFVDTDVSSFHSSNDAEIIFFQSCSFMKLI